MLTNQELTAHLMTQEVLLADGSVTENTFTWCITDETEKDATPEANLITSVEKLAQLDTCTGKKGILLTVDDDVETQLNQGDIPLDVDIIAIYFANFNDGRGYSYASLLRRLGYQGELRAVGDVFKDTLFYMKRCGFNSFVLKADKTIDEAKSGLTTFANGYQASNIDDSQYQTGA